MQQFEHKMRTSQHAKSVENIMTRTYNHFTNSKSSFKKLSLQGDNITTYLRKFQINRENQNLAKRIVLCQSEHSRDKYKKQWQNVKRFLRVRSNFKKTLHAKQPTIFKFQPILGKGKLKVDFYINHIDLPLQFWAKKNFYRFSFMLENHEIQPDKKLITMQFINTYQTTFYAPLFMKKKKVACKLYQVNQINYYEVASFQVDFSQSGAQQSLVFNKAGKVIGSVKFSINSQGGMKRLKKKSMIQKQNLPSLAHTQDCSLIKVNYYSESQP